MPFGYFNVPAQHPDPRRAYWIFLEVDVEEFAEKEDGGGEAYARWVSPPCMYAPSLCLMFLWLVESGLPTVVLRFLRRPKGGEVPRGRTAQTASESNALTHRYIANYSLPKNRK